MTRTDIERREFIKNTAYCLVCAGLAPSLLAGCDNGSSIVNDGDPVTLTVDITQSANTALGTVGGSVFVTNPHDSSRKIIVYRKSATEVNAFSSRCTHQGGQVGLFSNGKAVCSRHGSIFDIEGNAIGGPASRKLTTYQAVLDGSVIKITV